jgi:hypothetical protein
MTVGITRAILRSLRKCGPGRVAYGTTADGHSFREGVARNNDATLNCGLTSKPTYSQSMNPRLLLIAVTVQFGLVVLCLGGLGEMQRGKLYKGSGWLIKKLASSIGSPPRGDLFRSPFALQDRCTAFRKNNSRRDLRSPLCSELIGRTSPY